VTRKADIGMSLEEIAEAEGLSVGAVSMLLTRAFRKLRSEGLLKTARELARDLESHRGAENIVIVRRGVRGGQP
jgi:hypothetical protein